MTDADETGLRVTFARYGILRRAVQRAFRALRDRGGNVLERRVTASGSTEELVRRVADHDTGRDAVQRQPGMALRRAARAQRLLQKCWPLHRVHRIDRFGR